jgi:chromosome partitioning protein
MTGSTPPRRPGALGWPTDRAGRAGEDASHERVQGQPVGVGWPALTQSGTGGAADVASPPADGSADGSAPAPHRPAGQQPRSTEEDMVVSDDGVATGPPGRTSLEVSQTRIRHVLESAVVSRESGLPDAGLDTPIMREAAQAVRILNPSRSSVFPRPPHRRVITVANQKGGVGKTTSTVNLAVAFALHGLRVLVIDLDPQGNASTGLGVDHTVGVPSVYEVLVEGASIAETAVRVEQAPDLWCVPATIDLAGAEIELVSVVARETRLRTAIAAYDADVDYILIDCPPSLGLLTVNALVAGDEVFIPIQCEYYALEGLGQLLRNIELIQAHLNGDLRLSTILLTMYDGRTKLADQVAQEVRSHFGELVLGVVIPRSVRVSEAPGYGQSVMTYDPGSRGALTYLEAARDIAERGARDATPAASGTEESA